MEMSGARSPNLPVRRGSQITSVARGPAQRRTQSSARRSPKRSPSRTALSTADDAPNRTRSCSRSGGKGSMSFGGGKSYSEAPWEMPVGVAWKGSLGGRPHPPLRLIHGGGVAEEGGDGGGRESG